MNTVTQKEIDLTQADALDFCPNCEAQGQWRGECPNCGSRKTVMHLIALLRRARRRERDRKWNLLAEKQRGR